MAAGDVITVSEDGDGKKANVFDGTDDYQLHDAHAVARVLANDTVGTYTAWVYMDNLTGTQTILSAGDNNSVNEYLQLYTIAGKLSINIAHGGVDQFIVTETTASMTTKKWFHVAVVMNGTRPNLYVNGSAVAMTDTVSTDLTYWYDELTLVDKFAIGVLERNATHVGDWTGAIGRVQYFNIALDAEEIYQNYLGEAYTHRTAAIETARVFDITMEEDGITDDGSGADNGTPTGNTFYGGVVSDWSYQVQLHTTGHAAEFINSYSDGSKYISVIKRGD